MEGSPFDFSTHKKARKAIAIYETMGKGPRHPHKHSGRREMRALMKSLQTYYMPGSSHGRVESFLGEGVVYSGEGLSFAQYEGLWKVGNPHPFNRAARRERGLPCGRWSRSHQHTKS
jgi:hypothetical protein